MPGGNPGIPAGARETPYGPHISSRWRVGSDPTCFAAAGGAIVMLLFTGVLFERPQLQGRLVHRITRWGDVSEHG